MTIRDETILDGIPLFESFSRAERAAVVTRGRIFDLPAGKVLMRQGEVGDTLYVLISGEVRALRRDSSGLDVEVGRRGQGEFFGEMALIDGDVRSATVETVVPSRVFALERPVFLDVVAPSVRLLGKLLYELSRKFRDLSDRVVRDDFLRRTHDAEAELARHRAITQAVTGLAHELGTPLGICVTAASHLAAERADDAALREPISLIEDNLARAGDLVRAFVAIAAMEGGEPQGLYDLGDVVDHAIELARLERPVAGLDVHHAGAAAPCPWHGYRGQLERVIVELLLNVADHAFPDARTRPVTIEVATTFLEGRPAWKIDVADGGVGMEEPVRRAMFDAFFTTSRARGRKGLGLTFAYNAVTGPLAGRISITTAPGEGTRVVLVVPREPGT